MAAGSNPGPGSRTTISIPRASSQATMHSIVLVGSSFAPCTTALARASVKASSMSLSLPGAHCVPRTTSITLRTTGSTASRAAAKAIFSFMTNLSDPKLNEDCSDAMFALVSDHRLYLILSATGGNSKPHHCQIGRATCGQERLYGASLVLFQFGREAPAVRPT